MDIKKSNWYNGAICSTVLALSAPTNKQSEQCTKEAEECIQNLMSEIRLDVIKQAHTLAKSDHRVFNAWFRKNINSNMPKR